MSSGVSYPVTDMEKQAASGLGGATEPSWLEATESPQLHGNSLSHTPPQATRMVSGSGYMEMQRYVRKLLVV